MTAPIDFAAVTSLLEGAVGTVYPAAQLCCSRDGAAPLSVAVGSADLASQFDLASLTKALCTSVLAMQLWQGGRLDLDAVVLPGVAVRQLLSHVSGLPAWRPLFAEAQPGQDLAASPSEPGRKALVAAAAATERQPAGERAVYSDLGFILLGDLLERLVGERLDVQFARLAAQLGVEVGFRPLDRPLAVAADRCPITNRETADREPLRGVVHDDNARAMLGVAGHAGLFGTAAAVAAIGEALLDCYHDSGSRRQRSIGLTAATVRHFWALPTAPPGATFGLGWDHPTPALPGADAAAALSSAGRWWPRTGVGHLGFTGCSLWIDPPLRLCVVLLSNRVAVTTPEQAAQTQAGIRALRPALHDAVRCAYRL